MAKMKILIVDDEKQFCYDIAGYLTNLGHEVYNTYTGEQALGLLEKHKPDVLLCDLKLSGIGILEGDDILSRINSLSPKTVPIIITAYINEAVQKSLASKVARKCLFKPIQLQELEAL